MSTAKCVPFAWQDKRILRLIREKCEHPASTIGVYVALTEVASDRETDEFHTTHQWIAFMSGFCEKTVRSRLSDLQRLGVISITTPPLRAPCTYRLLPFGSDYPTSGNGCRSFGYAAPLSINEGTAAATERSATITEIRNKEEKNISVTVTERPVPRDVFDFNKLRKEVAFGPQT